MTIDAITVASVSIASLGIVGWIGMDYVRLARINRDLSERIAAQAVTIATLELRNRMDLDRIKVEGGDQIADILPPQPRTEQSDASRLSRIAEGHDRAERAFLGPWGFFDGGR